jgi:uncharacterized cysteine cluster protein YcgN (CxxCxxCC family)
MAARKPLSQDAAEPFWKTVPLAQMSESQWESLCDGCARCCLNKLLYEDTGEIAWTDVACKLLDGDTCRCGDYPNRHKRVSDCQALTPENVPGLTWLPPSCGYRLLAEGRDLYWWHPLVSGDPETVHAAGISVRGKTQNETALPPDHDLEDYIVAWPGEIPARAGERRR